MSFLAGFKSKTAKAAAAASAKIIEAKAAASTTLGALRHEWSTTVILQPEDLEFSDSINLDIQNASTTLSLPEDDLPRDVSGTYSGESFSGSGSVETFPYNDKSINLTKDVNPAGSILAPVVDNYQTKSGMSAGSNLGPPRPQIKLNAVVHNLEPALNSDSVDPISNEAESEQASQGMSQLLDQIEDMTVRGDGVDDREASGESSLVILDTEVAHPPLSNEAYTKQLKVRDDILRRKRLLEDQMMLLAGEMYTSEAVLMHEEQGMIKDLEKKKVKRSAVGKTAATNITESAGKDEDPGSGLKNFGTRFEKK